MRSAPKTLLDIEIASPCEESWSLMRGDDQVRFCARCSHHVYNLTGLSQAQAEALVTRHEGRMCVRLYRRVDGTIVTDDCPVGMPPFVRRSLLIGSVAAAFFLTIALLTLGLSTTPVRGSGVADLPAPIRQIWEIFFPPPRLIMGKVCPPPTPPALPEP